MHSGLTLASHNFQTPDEVVFDAHLLAQKSPGLLQAAQIAADVPILSLRDGHHAFADDAHHTVVEVVVEVRNGSTVAFRLVTGIVWSEKFSMVIFRSSCAARVPAATGDLEK